MKHTILNQHNKHIDGYKNIEKIKAMIRNGVDEIFVAGKRVTIRSDYRTDGERVTILNIEGL